MTSDNSAPVSSPDDRRESLQQRVNSVDAAIADSNRELANLQRSLEVARQELERIRRQVSATSDSFPFVAVQNVDSDVQAPSLKPKALPGLYYAQVVQSDAGGKLISVWQHREAFTAQGDALAAGFHIAASGRGAEFKGPQRLALTRKLSFPRRLVNSLSGYFGYVLALIATIAALLSHVDTIVDLCSQYTAPAVISIVGSETTLPVSVGQRFSTDFELQNESSFGSSHIRITKAEIRDKGGQAPAIGVVLDEFKARVFPLVKPAEAKTLTVPGRAIRPGVYTLRIEAETRPLYRTDQAATEIISETRTIEVWEAISIENLKSEPFRGAQACKAYFRIRSGQVFPKGLRFTAELHRIANVEFDGVNLSGVFDWKLAQPNRTPGQEAVAISWQSRRLESFDEIDGYLILVATDNIQRTAEAWNEIAKQIKFGMPIDPAE